MTAFGLLLLVLMPMALTSVGWASLPMRRVDVRLAVLALHLVVSALLIVFLGSPRVMWLLVLGPGLLISIPRLIAAAVSAEWSTRK